ncbi:MAG TPA: carboxypeptidase-like regulatory domain-containing protein [Bacteroidota bacterium]|nr:carboxypeptidase-like regulatory domain-containing protein [Bacteroidota bacterium]
MKLAKTIIIPIFIFLLWASVLNYIAFSQSSNQQTQSLFTVSGTVIDLTTKEPIINATVMIEKKGTTTDSSGHFIFNGIPVGKHRIAAASWFPYSFAADSISVPFNGIFTISLSFTHCHTYEEIARRDIDSGHVYLRQASGLTTTNHPPEDSNLLSAIKSLKARFGFETWDTGCIHDPCDQFYNKIVNSYLDKRNGKDWHDQYEKELAEILANKKQ